MPSYVDVSFQDRQCDRSIEGAVRRWVARLEAMRFDILGAAAAIACAGRWRTSVCLTVTAGDGNLATAACTHADPFVAVADAFRAVRRDLLARAGLPLPAVLAHA
ncbi:MAG TPA: hypothetical protein VIV58_19665 [Kofleriaceae bacterium]